jgi:simple sugar transport system ATP-binding protein
MSELLEARNLTKTFTGHRALDGVDFTVRAGEVHALMGENGAGKSTLIKTLTGFHPRDAGTILLDGREVSPRTPAHAQALGLSTVYQEVNLVPTLSVAENIYLGRQPTVFGKIRWGSITTRARAAMARLNVDIDVRRELSSYSIAIQQMVAIARALDVSAKLLILDEPTSSLDAGEVAQLFGVMRRLRGQGLGIVFVTHFLDQVYEVSDRITVLRNGKLVGEYAAAGLPRHDLVSKMMGRELASLEDLSARTATATAAGPGGETGRAGAGGAPAFLEARGLSRRGSLQPMDLTINPGEVVGLAGLLGSGRTETARLLFGIDHADGGQLLIDGRSVSLRSPRAAIRHRFGFLPEDRKVQGIIPDLSVRENIILALQARAGLLKYFSRAEQQRLADNYIKALNIATRDADTPIKNLSGGNQQKCVLARWLAFDPRFLILDEPTRGIDVGAKAEIQKLILSLAGEGKAILFISSELEEVVRCSDRVAVLRDRHKVGELAGDDVDEHTIMRQIAKGDA